jgi:hypothetical protein
MSRSRNTVGTIEFIYLSVYLFYCPTWDDRMVEIVDAGDERFDDRFGMHICSEKEATVWRQ